MAFRDASPKKQAAKKTSNSKSKNTSVPARSLSFAQQESPKSSLKRTRKQEAKEKDRGQEFVDSDDDSEGNNEPPPEPRKKSKRVSNVGANVPDRGDSDTPITQCLNGLLKMRQKVGFLTLHPAD
jgi:hypothetical protein